MRNNVVNINGRIAAVVVKKNVTITVIAVSRRINDKYVVNYPRIAWFSHDADVVAEEYKRGDRVNIEGVVITKRKTNESGISEYFQDIAGTSITIQSDEQVPKTKNEVKLKGSVTNVYSPNENIVMFNLCVNDEGNNNRLVYPGLIAYKKTAEMIKTHVSVGDEIEVTASVETHRHKLPNGDPINKENIVCHSFEKL